MLGRGGGVVFRALGPLEVLVDGKPASLGSPQLRLTLAALLVHANEVITAHQLVEIIWADTPPASALSTVQKLVYRLRTLVAQGRDQSTEDPVVVTRAPGYVLRVETARFDATQFADLSANAQRLIRQGTIPEALALLDEALGLWRGAAFEEFAFDEFARAEAAGLDELRLIATEERADAKLALGDHDELVGELEAFVSAHPYRERVWGQLMLSLYRAGRQAEALRAYTRVRELLGEGLGIEPGAALRSLEEAILLQKPELDWVPITARTPPGASVVERGEVPSGTVTFLFTDLEGSTRLWDQHPDGMKDALARHDEILRGAVEAHGGSVVKTTGDGVHAAFATARDAIGAAAEAQLGIVREPWEATGPLRVRMSVHTGEAEHRDGDYYGPAVNRAARLMSVAHGGQVVVSQLAEELVRDSLPEGVALVDLGEHRLRDLSRPERVFQLASAGRTDDFPPLRSLDAFPGNLPLQLTSFVGRDDELRTLGDLLADERLVTLTGVGGVGKTRLALQVAAEVLPSFPDGAWLCELAAAADGDSLEQLVAATLGVQPREGMSLGGAVCEFLRAKTLLVVLDNCEHLLDAVGRLGEDLLHACPQLRILATSRERLGVEGEHVHPLRSLELPDASTDPETVVRAEAARLFVERARSVTDELVLDATTAPAIGELCRRLDGVPLAIELAAARVAAMSPAEIAAHLDERFRLLTGGRRTAADRHQTLRATVDWSYSLLSSAEQTVFARLGTFPRTFDAAAAEAVAARDELQGWDVVDAVSSLVGKSMVVADRAADGSTRYSMLETLRAYARQRLDETGDPEVWRRRHAQHYAAFAEEAGPRLHSADELTWRPRLRVELDNLRAAVNWALDSPHSGDGELALRIIAALAYELPMDAATHVGVWATRAVPRADESTPGRRTAVLGAAAVQAVFLGDHETATALAHDALRDGLPPDCPAPMTTYTALAMAAAYKGQLDDARRILREPLPDLEAAGDLFALSTMYSTLSIFAWFAGDVAAAHAEGEKAVRLARHIGSPHALALALFSLGQATSRTDPPGALAAFEECIALVQSGGGGNIVLAGALTEAGRLRALTGDHVGAIRALRAAAAHARDTGNFSTGIGNLRRAIPPLVELDHPEPAAVLGGIVTQPHHAALDLINTTEIAERDQALDRARTQLGPEASDRAVVLGAAMSHDQAIAYALEELDRILTETRGQ